MRVENQSGEFDLSYHNVTPSHTHTHTHRPGDGALLLPLNQTVIHECYVEHVGRDSVIIKITDKAKQAW